MPKGKRPIKIFRVGNVGLSIWNNEKPAKDGKKHHSIQLNIVYGKSQNKRISLIEPEISKVVAVLQGAMFWLMEKR